jgi:hypothetical protein
MKDVCYRYRAKPDRYAQSYFMVSPFENNDCADFYPAPYPAYSHAFVMYRPKNNQIFISGYKPNSIQPTDVFIGML